MYYRSFAGKARSVATIRDLWEVRVCHFTIKLWISLFKLLVMPPHASIKLELYRSDD